MVSCKKCGAWVEINAREKPAEVLCPACGGAAAAPVAHKPSEGASDARGRATSIGPDSGAIGAGTMSDQGAGMTVQHGGLTMEKVSAELGREAEPFVRVQPDHVEAPPQRPAVVQRHGQPSSSGRTEAVKQAVKEHGREELGRARQVGEDFARQQAAKTVEETKEFVKEKGLKAVPQAGNFAKEQAHRVGQEARNLAEQQLKSAADRAAAAAHQTLGQASPKVEQLVRRPNAPAAIGTCWLCHDGITPGDHVVICPECNATYHKACYDLTGKCPSCTSRHRGQQTPVIKPAASGGPPIPMARPEGPTSAAGGKPAAKCSSCGAQLPGNTLVCPECGRWLYSGRKSANDPRGGNKPSPGGCSMGLMALLAFFILAVFLSIGH
jgi:predicted RNA-binding Zn-ribbon protein involved in translation (DUF1610 family)